MANGGAVDASQNGNNKVLSNCIQKDLNYCHKFMENSRCSYKKNQCFCSSGYVAIREFKRWSCKRLLTNHKCSFDSDCVEVSNSSCHPGAGRCSCPAEAVFVPEMFACRMRLKNYGNSKLCIKCESLGGICYKLSLTDIERGKTMNYERSYGKDIGCSCHSNRVSLKTGIKHLCTGYLADIGEYCDDQSHICRSQTAQCMLQKGYATSSKVCTCTDHNTVAVYQPGLAYKECYTRFGVSRSECRSCIKAGGMCYDSDNDKIPDSCQCPPYSSHGKDTDEIEKNKGQLCSVKHVQIQCSRSYVSVCYKPHFHYPYSDLEDHLKRNLSRVGINTHLPQSEHNRECMLQLLYEHEKLWCRNLTLAMLAACSVSQVIQQGKILYKAQLHIESKNIPPSHLLPSITLPLQCETTVNESERKKLLLLTRKLKLTQLIQFKIRGINNRNVDNVIDGERIQLMFQMNNESDLTKDHDYYIDLCYLTYTGLKLKSKKLLVIYNTCYEENSKISFTPSISPFSLPHSTISTYHSSRFIPFQGSFKDQKKAKFTCRLRFCYGKCEKKTCKNRSPISPSSPSVPSYSSSSLSSSSSYPSGSELERELEMKGAIGESPEIIIEKQINVERRLRNQQKDNSISNSVSVQSCSHFICLTSSQTLLLSLLVITLGLAFAILIFIYSRTRQNHHQSGTTPLFSMATNTQTPRKAQTAVSPPLLHPVADLDPPRNFIELHLPTPTQYASVSHSYDATSTQPVSDHSTSSTITTNNRTNLMIHPSGQRVFEC